MRQGNATLIAGVENDQVEAAVAVIEETCGARRQLVPASMDAFDAPPVEVTVGGATVFVVPVEMFRKV